MELTEYQKDVLYGKICPYCKSSTRITTELEIYGKSYKGRAVIACKNFPNCDAYVGTHDDGEPLGRLANKKLRNRKTHAHFWFDKIWQEGYIQRTELYTKMSEGLNIPLQYAHIGMFNNDTCMRAASWAKVLYKSLTANSYAGKI